MPPPPTLAFIGLGSAGSSLASTLSHAGHPLLISDTNPLTLTTFTHLHPTATPAPPNTPSAFTPLPIIITMLPNGSIVRDVLLSLAPSLSDGTILIDTSSSSPTDTLATATALHEINPSLTLLDAPVTQPYAFALAKGDATIMVGCSNPLALEKAMPILKTMASHVFVMGGLGAGHAMKTLNNYVSAASILGLCDALMAGQKYGLDVREMVEVMNVGTGGNFSTRESFRTEALTRKFASGYQLSLLLKDMKIARELIDEMGQHSALSDLIVDTLAEADEIAGPGACHTQVIQAWEAKAGVQLRQSDGGE